MVRVGHSQETAVESESRPRSVCCPVEEVATSLEIEVGWLGWMIQRLNC